jgi:hypothetical protein
MNRANGDSLPVFTPRQGQYLAFIHAYTLVNGRPPAQADIQRFFQLDFGHIPPTAGSPSAGSGAELNLA